MAVSHSHVNSNRIKDGFATEEEIQRVMMALGVLVECDLWIEHPKTNDLYSIRALVREHYRRHGLDLVVIDYLQMMEIGSDHSQPRRKNENRQQEVSAISRSTKMLATELDIPVIGVCQLSRAVEARDGHRPRLSDLRESGSLEQDADVVLLLYRDDYYNRDSQTPNICEIDVAKNRSGRTGVIETVFLRDMLLFESKADMPVGDGFAPSDARVPD
jgi:replicative DNA helicase